MTAGFRLEHSDESPHTPDSSPSWNESVYGNAFDPVRKVGGWLRVGNRINEGAAEVSVCLYLPDGRVACQFGKPKISTHQTWNAGGLSYRVDAPFAKVTFDYDGPVYLLDDPTVLRRPKEAFTPEHQVPCTLHWEQSSLTAPHGGEPLTADQPTAYGRDFSLGHFNLHTKVRGQISVGSESFPFDGQGWRDHSWGPRYWQNLFAHRLFTANFGDDLGLTLHKIEDADGTVRRLGTFFQGGRHGLRGHRGPRRRRPLERGPGPHRRRDPLPDGAAPRSGHRARADDGAAPEQAADRRRDRRVAHSRGVRRVRDGGAHRLRDVRDGRPRARRAGRRVSLRARAQDSSRTSRIFRSSASGVSGFCRKATREASTRWSTAASSV